MDCAELRLRSRGRAVLHAKYAESLRHLFRALPEDTALLDGDESRHNPVLVYKSPITIELVQACGTYSILLIDMGQCIVVLSDTEYTALLEKMDNVRGCFEKYFGMIYKEMRISKPKKRREVCKTLPRKILLKKRGVSFFTDGQNFYYRMETDKYRTELREPSPGEMEMAKDNAKTETDKDKALKRRPLENKEEKADPILSRRKIGEEAFKTMEKKKKNFKFKIYDESMEYGMEMQRPMHSRKEAFQRSGIRQKKMPDPVPFYQNGSFGLIRQDGVMGYSQLDNPLRAFENRFLPVFPPEKFMESEPEQGKKRKRGRQRKEPVKNLPMDEEPLYKKFCQKDASFGNLQGFSSEIGNLKPFNTYQGIEYPKYDHPYDPRIFTSFRPSGPKKIYRRFPIETNNEIQQSTAPSPSPGNNKKTNESGIPSSLGYHSFYGDKEIRNTEALKASTYNNGNLEFNATYLSSPFDKDKPLPNMESTWEYPFRKRKEESFKVPPVSPVPEPPARNYQAPLLRGSGYPVTSSYSPQQNTAIFYSNNYITEHMQSFRSMSEPLPLYQSSRSTPRTTQGPQIVYPDTQFRTSFRFKQDHSPSEEEQREMDERRRNRRQEEIEREGELDHQSGMPDIF